MEESKIIEWVINLLAKQEIKTVSTYGVYVAFVSWPIGKLIDKSDKILSFFSQLIDIRSKKVDLEIKELELEKMKREMQHKSTNRKKS